MIYIDHVHMVSDTLKELHDFADSIGLSRSYYEGVKKGHPHYDLLGHWYWKVRLTPGVKVVDSKTILEKSKQMINQPSGKSG